MLSQLFSEPHGCYGGLLVWDFPVDVRPMSVVTRPLGPVPQYGRPPQIRGPPEEILFQAWISNGTHLRQRHRMSFDGVKEKRVCDFPITHGPGPRHRDEIVSSAASNKMRNACCVGGKLYIIQGFLLVNPPCKAENEIFSFPHIIMVFQKQSSCMHGR